MPEPDEIIFTAAAFAARVHRHQLRKDGATPYVSHTFRACLIVRHIFGFDDPRMMATSLLHDTIEDTATDCDDIIEHFGSDVARWVALLTKDMRMPESAREAAYVNGLTAAEWQVKACKLADIYDNLMDSKHLTAEGRQKTAARARAYLEAIRTDLPKQLEKAFQLTEEKWNALVGRR